MAMTQEELIAAIMAGGAQAQATGSMQGATASADTISKAGLTAATGGWGVLPSITETSGSLVNSLKGLGGDIAAVTKGDQGTGNAYADELGKNLGSPEVRTAMRMGGLGPVAGTAATIATDESATNKFQQKYVDPINQKVGAWAADLKDSLGISGGGAPASAMSPELQAAIEGMQNRGGGSGLGGGIVSGGGELPAFTTQGINLPEIQTLVAQGVDPITAQQIVASKAANVANIDPMAAITAQQATLGGESKFVGDQSALIKTLQDRVSGNAPTSLAELQMRKAQQDMVNQVAAQAGSMSGRSLPAAQRQLMQMQAQSGQQLAMDSGILRAQEQQAAEAQLAGALGTFRGQDQTRTGLQSELDIANQNAALQAAMKTGDINTAIAKANQATQLGISLADLETQTAVDQANQAAALAADKANLSSQTQLSAADLAAAVSGRDLSATQAFDAQTFEQGQNLEAQRLAEQQRQADVTAGIQQEDIASKEAIAALDAQTKIATADSAAQAKKEADDLAFKRNLAGSIISSAGTYAAS